MKLSTRELATLAVFGALWGLVEISLGAFLKSLNIPLSGMLLAAIGLFIAFIGRVFVPKAGSTIFIGVIATFLKLFSLGGVIIGPMVGILTEAIVAEIALTSFKKPSRLAFTVAGALGVTWVLVQPFITNPLLFGRTLFVVWLDLLDQGSRLFGFDTNAVFFILLIYLAIHVAVGSNCGLAQLGCCSDTSCSPGETAQPTDYFLAGVWFNPNDIYDRLQPKTTISK